MRTHFNALLSKLVAVLAALTLLGSIAFAVSAAAPVAQAHGKPGPLPYIQCSSEKWVVWDRGSDSYNGSTITVTFWVLEDSNTLGYCGQMENQTTWSGGACNSYGTAFEYGAGAYHQQSAGTTCSSGYIDNVYSPATGHCWHAWSWIDDPSSNQWVSAAKCI